MRVLTALLLLHSGCFDPEETDGDLRCGPGGACPSGFVCQLDHCWRDRGGEPLVPADGAPPTSVDARSYDAARAIDAAAPCMNGIDDDCDGRFDQDDPGCGDADDDDGEHGGKECDDGIDNDGDGFIDFHIAGCGSEPSDPGCDKVDDDDENG